MLNGSLILHFTDKPTRDVLTKLSKMSTDVTVKWGGSASESALAELSGRILSKLEALPSIESVAGNVTPDDFTVIVTYKPVAGTGALGKDVINTLLTELAVLHYGGVLPAPVTVRHFDGLEVGGEVAIKGGQKLGPTDGNPAYCTGGFGVISVAC